jgi:hypothetical protein
MAHQNGHPCPDFSQKPLRTEHLQSTSSFRGIAGFIGDEPGIHFDFSRDRMKLDSRLRGNDENIP